jgi:hypothetical protein
MATRGIGIRRHEGFGWISVNPPWLADRFIDRHENDSEPDHGRAISWPGTTASNEQLAAWFRVARSLGANVGSDEEKRRKLRALAQYAARATDLAQVRAFEKERCKFLADAVRGTLEETRFILEAMATLAGRGN